MVEAGGFSALRRVSGSINAFVRRTRIVCITVFFAELCWLTEIAQPEGRKTLNAKY
jgi:hypothetical protein